MTAALYVNDNNTARRIRELWVNDNGTARRIRAIWVNDNGTARLVFAGVILTAGQYTNTATGFITYNGLWSGTSPVGTLSPDTAPDGHLVFELSSRQVGNGIRFALSGFGASPGQSYLASLEVNGVTVTGAGASTYTYGSLAANTAAWTWSASTFGIANGGTYDVSISLA